MLAVKFEDFRGFQDSGWVEIRPITLLIGENSAGKTSFLAGVRYLLEAFSRSSSAPFNRAPYFLGGFEQIAHVRGGRTGRAKNFKLSIRIPETESNQLSFLDTDQHTTHSFSFGKGYPQPEIEAYRLLGDDLALTLSFAHETPRGTISRLSGEERMVNLSFRRAPPSAAIKNNNGYIPFLIDDLRFHLDVPGRARDGGPEAGPDLTPIGLTLNEARKFWQGARTAGRILTQDVFASAPVRTQPSRTYTPSELIASSEGSHVPLELARTKLRSPSQWEAMKKRLVSFGQRSGLFTDIDIKQFGKSDIDPFQLLVKIDGPAMNLVDVGYGISQVLPIIYQVQNPTRFSTFLLQQPEVHLHPRAQAELGTVFAQAISRPKAPLFIIETHSDYIIDRLRIEIAQKRIESNKVTIIFFQRQQHGSEVSNLFLNDLGEIVNAPEDFRSFFLEEHARLLGIV
jgi:hypothetical protein